MDHNKKTPGRGNRVSAALAIALILLASSSISFALVHPLDEEALEAYFREKTAENYGRMVLDKIEDLKGIDDFILDNPDIYDPGIRGIMNSFVMLLGAFYVTSIIVTGIYLIFFSGTPKSRSRAKSYLLLALIAMALITVSAQALMLFFGLSQSLTMLVLSLSPIDAEEPFIHATSYLFSEGSYIMSHKGPSSQPSGEERAGLPMLFTSYILLEAALALLQVRVYMVTLLAIIFPITITFYAFLPFRRIGKLLAEQTVLWTFSQIAMAFVLIVVAIGVDATSLITSFDVPDMLMVIIEVAGLVMLAIAPLFFVKWFSGFL